ncbi:prolyl oligopeptidase family serine peptidase [Aquibacillus halophilus]|uniref:Prolyl oligopeptidase family serine peptidase n=1 Tax=Aquibacillus halophilus TaxID=930132 RepID=A0A6A8DHZ8_9BACI|nr:prolyl oligopeptidase family serine peptidase [Aquibacillus halophilus]MRH43361.1 prolyl oligopeptidase family serine peptidase [Aquibacillus halophilus]
MIGIYKEYWKDIPVLVVVQDEKKDKPLPVLTYFHGYTSAKEHNLPLAFLLAERGYRVILPDSMLHGEREKFISNDERQLQFFDIVEQNLIDMQVIKDVLDSKKMLLDRRLGVAGTSMGGITTAAALTKYDWIKVAAVLMGSPKISEYAKELVDHMRQMNTYIQISDEEIEKIYKSLEKIDLSKHMDKLNGRPLFFWHGEKDSVVPFDHSYNFYSQAVSYYKNPESIRFLREVGRDHKVSRFAVLETVDWLEMQL